MNASALMKIMQAKNTFENNHPKFLAFLKVAFGSGIEPGTVIEISVQKPGEEKITTNLCVQQSDLDLLEGLKELKP